ncbi:hypothetical protein ACL1CZ_13430 [Corynebacterium striatum]
MSKPSDMPHRCLEVGRATTTANYNALTAFADQAAFLMRYYLDRGYDYDASLTLTEITLDRYDNTETI